MTSAEQTLVNAALNDIASHFAATARIQWYITEWKNDVAGMTNCAAGESQITSGQSFKSVPVVAVAGLPANPSTNDEAIVTDAMNLTAGGTVAGSGTARVLVKYSSGWKIQPGALTVATLPASPATNDEAVVTDATVATNGTTVVGGGSTRVLVRYDGANWKIV